METQVCLGIASRSAWRAWLEDNHRSSTEAWLATTRRSEAGAVEYLDAVEEALCFGWIDGIAKRLEDTPFTAQRFTPRRRRSHWTELNKQRVRRLKTLGLMRPAGLAAVPDFDEPFKVAIDIAARISALPEAATHFRAFPPLYVRVRVGYIEEMRKRPAEFEKRLNNFIRHTAHGKLFGNWNDGGRLSG
ncbi:MAG: YdeI/OmpD-associated family protein [Planctomycetota bacterium]